MQPLFLFKILGVPFFSFTTLAALGIVLAIVSAITQPGSPYRGRAGLHPALWVSAGGLAGGRLLHIAYNFGYFVEHRNLVLHFEDGGMAFVGLFCGGSAGLWLWSRRNQISFSNAANHAALSVSVLASLAWLGAFLHGSQYGAPVDNALALELRDTFGVIEVRWPTQLLAAAWCALLSLTLIARQKKEFGAQDKEPRSGAALIFLAGYGIAMFLFDFTRGDASPLVAGLRLTQIFYLSWGMVSLYSIGRSLTSA